MFKMTNENLCEKSISQEEIFNGKIINLNVDKVILPNGKNASREVVHHPGAVAIIPILENGDIVLVKQYRYPLDNVIYEVPAGKLEKGEDPKDCALRELSEETGFVVKEIELLGKIATTPGFTDEIIHIYRAFVSKQIMQNLDEDEFIEVVTFSKQKVREMVKSGEIFDGKTLSSLLLHIL